MPRNEYSYPDYIEIKLKNNYNIGINASNVIEMKKIGKKEAKYKIPEKEFPKNKTLPNVILLGTGGTVASRLDYTTGAVIPSFTPGELFSSVPELAEICNLETEIVFELLSENMRPEYWQQLAEKVEKAANLTTKKRLIIVLIGGMIVGMGSHFARGCASGAAMTGMVSLSLSGFVAFFVMFGVAFIIARLVKKIWI